MSEAALHSLPYLYAVVLVVMVLGGWVMTALAMPGNWLIVASAVVYAAFMPGETPERMLLGWQTVGILFGLAVLGEILELVAGAVGVKKVGGSKRGAVLAICGSVTGAIIGAIVGVPIPVVGSLVAAIVFGGCGALIGAMIGEGWKGRTFDESLKVGSAAFLGRLAGTAAKLAVATVMVLVTLAALVLA